MTDRSPRVVSFVSAELQRLPNDRAQARVVLSTQGQHCIGETEGDGAELQALRSVAEATAQALVQAVGTPRDVLEVQGLGITEPLGKRTVCVALDAKRSDEQRQLMGFCVVEGDATRAAALAVLNGSNRFLSAG